MEKLRYKLGPSGRLTPKEIIDIVDDYKKSTVPEILMREDYAKGNNPGILNRKLPADVPNNQVPVPYGRRILSIITSYMFLPGSITYAGEEVDQTYLDALNEIFEVNEEPLESYRMGWQTSLHGVGYEIFYGEGTGPELTQVDAKPGFMGRMPRFERIPLAETVALYDFEISPNLIAFIRFYNVESEEVEYIQVYYADVVESFERKKNSLGLARTSSEKHGYARPPLVVYENNEDTIGDFSAVQSLIDAYDVLMSDSMNEFDRFAQAYLVAKGFSVTTDQAKKLKQSRVFNLSAEDSVEFLTKPIEVEFIRFMSEQLRAEIHRGAGIPNLDDYKWGGGASGETIDKFIYLMELFTGVKEAYFVRGLHKRIEMLTEYMNLAGDPKSVEIIMNRNDPDKSTLQADLFGKYSGHISEKTLIENFADFVPDADAELEQLKAEKDQAVEDFMRQNPPEEDEEEEEPEEPKGPPKPGEKKEEEK